MYMLLPWTCGSDRGRGMSLNVVQLYTGKHRASAALETETLSAYNVAPHKQLQLQP